MLVSFQPLLPVLSLHLSVPQLHSHASPSHFLEGTPTSFSVVRWQTIHHFRGPTHQPSSHCGGEESGKVHRRPQPTVAAGRDPRICKLFSIRDVESKSPWDFDPSSHTPLCLSPATLLSFAAAAYGRVVHHVSFAHGFSHLLQAKCIH